VKDPRIVPEMGVRVSFLEQAQPQAAAKPQGVRVPAGAVVQREGASVAFVLGDQSRVQQRTVEAGQAMGKDRQILKGVSAGESVVVNPPDTLRDGAKVQQKQAQ
ncbi:MAG: efflux RND transporter periplasmic adaptor subunit, partial [Lysobacteraceae bacterium]